MSSVGAVGSNGQETNEKQDRGGEAGEAKQRTSHPTLSVSPFRARWSSSTLERRKTAAEQMEVRRKDGGDGEGEKEHTLILFPGDQWS